MKVYEGLGRVYEGSKAPPRNPKQPQQKPCSPLSLPAGLSCLSGGLVPKEVLKVFADYREGIWREYEKDIDVVRGGDWGGRAQFANHRTSRRHAF